MLSNRQVSEEFLVLYVVLEKKGSEVHTALTRLFIDETLINC